MPQVLRRVAGMRHTGIPLLLLVLIGCATLATAQQKPQATYSTGVIPQTAKYSGGQRPGSSKATPAKYELLVTDGFLKPSPDCFDRKVILVNNQFMPQLELTQGDWVEITVKNQISKEWPAITGGLTIHWHGFSMHGFPFQDGTRFVSQCPIAPGKSFTYRFQVNEMPGTYFWHDHAAMYRADGLQGPLIVKEKPGAPVMNKADGDDHALILADWWHFAGNSLVMRLNRPIDPAKVANGSGEWCWVGVPKALLINGRGNYWDCEDVYKRKVGNPLPYRAKPVTVEPKDLMAPSVCLAGQLGPKAEPAMCSVQAGASGPGAACSKNRAVFEVTPGKTSRFRLINGAQLVYMTVCFEGHTVTVVALDAAPVTPKEFKECVDINLGQRVDVLIKADQPSDRSYWISVGSQYRKGAPSGYAVMKYKGASKPPTPDTIMQPNTAATKVWDTATTMSFTTPEQLLNAAGSSSKGSSSSSKPSVTSSFIAPAVPGQPSFKLPKRDVDKRYVIQATQPILQENGILRWALNSVAHTDAPPCTSVIQDVAHNPKWSKEEALHPTKAEAAGGTDHSAYFTRFGGSSSTWTGRGYPLQLIDASGPNANVLNDLKKPGPGTHVLTIDSGNPIVEIVLQNNRAGLYGGEYKSAHSNLTDTRNGQEQHAFHLHGFHFWLVGMGMGMWTPDKVDGQEYNLVNPVLRDTATVLFSDKPGEDKTAWVAIRFVANNPGAWPFHCHIAWHQVMGQGMNVIVDPEAIAKMKEPADMPSCPNPCLYDFSTFAPTAVAATFGKPYSNPKTVTEAGPKGSGAADSSSAQGILLAPDNDNLP